MRALPLLVALALLAGCAEPRGGAGEPPSSEAPPPELPQDPPQEEPRASGTAEDGPMTLRLEAEPAEAGAAETVTLRATLTNAGPTEVEWQGPMQCAGEMRFTVEREDGGVGDGADSRAGSCRPAERARLGAGDTVVRTFHVGEAPPGGYVARVAVAWAEPGDDDGVTVHRVIRAETTFVRS